MHSNTLSVILIDSVKKREVVGRGRRGGGGFGKGRGGRR